MRRIQMMNIPGQRLCLILLAAWWIVQPAWAEKPEKLVQAWQEYQFLSMDLAQKYFNEVLELDTEPRYQREAKVGLAMVSQFREQGEDLDLSEKLYNEVLEQDPPEEIRNLIHSFQADLSLSRGEDEKALEILTRLAQSSKDTVLGQDAQIRKLILTMGAYNSPESLAAAAETEQFIAEIQAEVTPERPYLLAILHFELGSIYFWANEYKKAVEHLEAFTTLGNATTTSYGSQSAVLYRAAKIYENKLQQPEAAGAFYRRVITEYPNSGFSYYALEKAVAYKAISRSVVEKMQISGLTTEILDELFGTVKGEDN